MRVRLLLLAIAVTISLNAQNDSDYVLRVHFLYGSRPKWKHRHVERKEFGGLHGGHVTLQVNGYDYGFERANGFHVFPHRTRLKAQFLTRNADSVSCMNRGSRTATFIIPLNARQFGKLNEVHAAYCGSLPYDYAFFGMRCAASVREILGHLDILKKKRRVWYIAGYFYPKRLRKKLFRLAAKNDYQVILTEGRDTRKWERD